MVKEGDVGVTFFFFMEMRGFLLRLNQFILISLGYIFSFDVALVRLNDSECSRMILGIFLCVLKNSFELN